MFKLKKFIILPALFIFVMVVACSSPAETDSLETAFEMPIQDRYGLDITVPEEMTRIISMAPSVTVTLIDLGLEDRIVAMDQNSAIMLGGEVDVPTFDMLNPEIESLIMLEPDFIFASTISMMGDVANDPFAPLRELGIGVAYIPSSESIEAIKEDIRFIAAVVSEVEVGEEIILEMEHEIEEIIDLIDDNPATLTVYFEISPAPDMFSFGNGVFQHEVLELIGAENIFADVSGWLSVEAESVVLANPEIIFTNVNFIDDPVAEILSRPGWEDVSAVQNGRVFFIDNDDTSLPTHHIVRGMRVMAEYLHGVD